MRAGRGDELVPFAGQTVGLIDAIVSVRDVIAALVTGARDDPGGRFRRGARG